MVHSKILNIEEAVNQTLTCYEPQNQSVELVSTLPVFTLFYHRFVLHQLLMEISCPL